MKKLLMLTVALLMLGLFSIVAPKAAQADDGYKEVALLGCGCGGQFPVFLQGKGFVEGDTCAETLEIHLNAGFEIEDAREVGFSALTTPVKKPKEGGLEKVEILICKGIYKELPSMLLYTLVREAKL